MTEETSGYVWENAELNSSHDYLLPALKGILAGERLPQDRKRLFELGCGNGSVANQLVGLGWEVTGVDPPAGGCRCPDLPCVALGSTP